MDLQAPGTWAYRLTNPYLVSAVGNASILILIITNFACVQESTVSHEIT